MTKPLILITGTVRSGTPFLIQSLNCFGVPFDQYHELHSRDISLLDYNLRMIWKPSKFLN
jgi:hypothetical protein